MPGNTELASRRRQQLAVVHQEQVLAGSFADVAVHSRAMPSTYPLAMASILMSCEFM